MRAQSRVLSLAAVTAAILLFSLVTFASANVSGKSIFTESGECLPGDTGDSPPCTAAIYGPNGFSGQIFFESDEIDTTVQLVDYICVHTPGAGSFVSFGGPSGTSTFTLSESGAPLGSALETVTSGEGCTGGTDSVTAGSVSFVVPADGSVDYTLAVTGITSGASAQAAFGAGYNSILNRVVEIDGNQANSVSVPPPTNFQIPEAPLAILLVLSGGLLVGWFLVRRTRNAPRSAH